MKDNEMYDIDGEATIVPGAGPVKLELSSYYGKMLIGNAQPAMTEEQIIERLMMTLDEIEELDNTVKEDHLYFREEVRRIMNTAFDYLKDKKISGGLHE